MNGHLGVVPAGDHDEWTYPPYGGVIEDGRLYGRGSVDMKTAIAIAMLTALNLRSAIENGSLDGSIVVHAAIGEETADPGTKSLLDAGFDGDVGVVLEPTQCRVATSEKEWRGTRFLGLESPHTRATLIEGRIQSTTFDRFLPD
nr:M20/M25/M40 family metallo-hydrolase [Natrialba sp. SSL1]